VDYPAPFASLARLKPENPRVAERFELYVAGVELCNGFGELTDPTEQRARLLRDQAERKRLNKPVYPIDERFLAALMEGMPPAAATALGAARLIAVCPGAEPTASARAFPAGWLCRPRARAPPSSSASRPSTAPWATSAAPAPAVKPYPRARSSRPSPTSSRAAS